MQEYMGKSVLITGATMGIGKACAIRFAQEGAKIFINYDKNDEAARDTLSLVNQWSKGNQLIKGDIGNRDALEELCGHVLTRNPPEVLVLNASYQEKKCFCETDWDLLQKTFDVNVMGNFYLAQQYIKSCRRQGKQGVIVVHSSNQSEFVNPTGFAYSLSKAALNQMVKHLALETAKDRIRVNGIVLGWFDTEGERNFYSPEKMRMQAAQGIPLGRIGEAEEVANLTYYLASPQAAYMTGSMVRLDGGYALSPDPST